MIASCVGMQRKGLLLQAAQDITVLTELLMDLDSAIEEFFVSFVTNSDFFSRESIVNVSTLLYDYQNEVNTMQKLLHDYCLEISRVSQLIQQGRPHV